MNSNTYGELVCVLRKIEKSQRMNFVNVERCNGSSFKATDPHVRPFNCSKNNEVLPYWFYNNYTLKFTTPKKIFFLP